MTLIWFGLLRLWSLFDLSCNARLFVLNLLWEEYILQYDCNRLQLQEDINTCISSHGLIPILAWIPRIKLRITMQRIFPRSRFRSRMPEIQRTSPRCSNSCGNAVTAVARMFSVELVLGTSILRCLDTSVFCLGGHLTVLTHGISYIVLTPVSSNIVDEVCGLIMEVRSA